jgi:hypothetical protein
MHSVIEDVTRTPLWTRALEAKFGPAKRQGPFSLTRRDWDEILYDCQAVTDVPAAFFGPELAAAYPEAKIVILNRDVDAWYRSIQATFGQMQRWSPVTVLKMLVCSLIDVDSRNFLRFSKTMRTLAVGFSMAADEKKAKRWFEERYQEFRDGTEEERRLEYKVQDGWWPLCEFLGVPVPVVEGEGGELVERPFPRVNDKDMYMATYRSMIQGCVERSKHKAFVAIGKATLVATFVCIGIVAYRNLC